jgi:hypothetical protein
MTYASVRDALRTVATGEVVLDAALMSVEDLVRAVVEAKKSGAMVTIQNGGHLSFDAMVALGGTGPGCITFE